MKRLFLAILFALLAVVPAYAVPVPGTWDAGQQPISYPVIGADGNYNEVNGDGSNAHGGVPPAFAIQPANVPSTVNTQVTSSGGATTGDNELKFRFTQFGMKADRFDLIKGYCIRSFGHLHEFVGPRSLGACSTYAQVRAACVAAHNAGRLASTNQGDDINCSAYWHSIFIDCFALGNICRAKREQFTPLYYQIDGGSCNTLLPGNVPGFNACVMANIATRYVDLAMQLNYISGKSFVDPWNLKLTNAKNIANAANSPVATAAGYGYSVMGGLSDGTGISYICTTDGTNGATLDLLTCGAGANVALEMHGKACWDGRNLSSPDGESHVFPPLKVHAANGDWTDVCPKFWFHIPVLNDKTEITLYHAISSSVAGDEPYLDSDAGFQAAARAQAGVCVGSGATQACAPGNAATFVCMPGCSGHYDYVVMWDKKFLRRAFRKCLGIPQTDPSETGLDADQTPVGTACNAGTLSTSAGTNSVLNFPATLAQYPSVNGDRIQEYWPIPLGHTGPGMIMGANDNAPAPANDNATQLAGAAPVSFDLRRAGGR